MIIVYVISRLNVGGPTILLNSLCKGLQENGHIVYVITGNSIKEEGSIPCILPKSNILYVEGLTPGSSLNKTFSAYLQIKKIIKKIQPDVVHTHMAKAGFLGRIAANKLGIKKIIHTFHGHVFEGYFGAVKTKAIIFLEQYLAKKSHHIICISPSIHKNITEKFRICFSEKAIQQEIGIDIEKYHHMPDKKLCQESLNLPQGKPIISFIGRLAPIKDPLFFVQLAHQLLAKNLNIHFLLIGDGPLQAETDQLIKDLKIDKHISRFTWMPDSAKALKATDILLMCSNNEGTPMILLEAMASQTLIISNPCGGIKDLIAHQKNGYLVKKEFNAYIKQIEEVIKSLEPSIKKNAFTFVKEQHNEKKFIQSSIDLYSQGS